ncbi:unnamed protein product [Cladocopium goreaui]|uniref:Uncharacterized protein n=1 Tax=Cladocopium goreaui TaxID=2562237 RepID=A0A9P1FGZ3_9DINO|nr:unnamed protein product [Cladocopium goreaui]
MYARESPGDVVGGSFALAIATGAAPVAPFGAAWRSSAKNRLDGSVWLPDAPQPWSLENPLRTCVGLDPNML